MAQTYNTRDGDVLDAIAWRQYGRVDQSVLDAILSANPGLSEHGAVLPAGVAVVLPDIPRPSQVRKVVTLWD